MTNDMAQLVCANFLEHPVYMLIPSRHHICHAYCHLNYIVILSVVVRADVSARSDSLLLLSCSHFVFLYIVDIM